MKLFHFLRDEIRMQLWRRGLDVVRRFRLVPSLAHRGISVVIDVGANEGQYGMQLRRLGYRGRIISFEPNKESFRRLRQLAARDNSWETFGLALGDKTEERNLNITVESVFSSFLESAREQDVAGLAASAERQKIPVERLDNLLPQLCAVTDRVFLKTDTQGFDHQVVEGAGGVLDQLQGIQIELSLAPFYQNQPLIGDTIEFLREKGFALWAVQPVFTDWITGRTRELDGIFWRE
jgi:FkbM family methyltransferase